MAYRTSRLQPWLIWPPGIVMALTTVGFGLLGDEVRDATTETWQTSSRRTKGRSLLNVRCACWVPCLFGSVLTRAVAPEREASGSSPGVREVAEPPSPDAAGNDVDEPSSGAPSAVAGDRFDVDVDVGPDNGERTPERALLALQRVSIGFPSAHGSTPIIEDVSFELAPGETLGLVGESGCGKTMTAMAILGLLPSGGEITAATSSLRAGTSPLCPEKALHRLRGKEIGLISQEPMVALNPAFRVGSQLEHCRARAPRHLAQGGADPRGRAPGPRPTAGSRGGRTPLPARALRRYGPARRDRARAFG